jgi:hypothetical protein
MASATVDRSDRNLSDYRGWHTRCVDPFALESISAEGVVEESACASIVDSRNAFQFDVANNLKNARRYSGTSSLAPNSVNWKAACTNRT